MVTDVTDSRGQLKSFWQSVYAAFDIAIAMDADKRPDFLAKRCTPEISEEVQKLLDAEAEKEQPAAKPSQAENKPQRIGRYRVLSLIGQGGMAKVYLAERDDGQFQRQVALKVIRPAAFESTAKDRFLQERQILADLHHPNIAQLIDGGVTDDGRPFIAMELVKGTQISRYCDENNLTIKERISLFLKVCDAVQFAHGNLIVHRDLKPSNILVTDEGVPKLLDFGIAKLLRAEDQAMQTLSGLRVMTPEYAAPEQFFGQPVTTATDVYALGVLLYELLSGHSPFVGLWSSGQGDDTVQPPPLSEVVAKPTTRRNPESGVRENVSPEDVAKARRISLSQLKKELTGDLERVINKAMSRKPEDRYQSAEALSTDIQLYQQQLPVIAHPDSFAYRVAKFGSRHRLAIPLGVLVIATLATGLVLALRQVDVAKEAAQAQDSTVKALRIQQAEADQVNRLLARLLLASNPSATTQELIALLTGLREYGTHLDRRFKDDPLIRAELEMTAAQINIRLNQYDSSRRLLEETLTLQKNAGAGPLILAKTFWFLGHVHDKLGNAQEGERYRTSALELDPNAAAYRILDDTGETAK